VTPADCEFYARAGSSLPILFIVVFAIVFAFAAIKAKCSVVLALGIAVVMSSGSCAIWAEALIERTEACEP
jgi:hypothetical protein